MSSFTSFQWEPPQKVPKRNRLGIICTYFYKTVQFRTYEMHSV